MTAYLGSVWLLQNRLSTLLGAVLTVWNCLNSKLCISEILELRIRNLAEFREFPELRIRNLAEFPKLRIRNLAELLIGILRIADDGDGGVTIVAAAAGWADCRLRLLAEQKRACAFTNKQV